MPEPTTPLPTLSVVEHPLVQHKISCLREKRTPQKLFREMALEIAMLMTYDATRDLAREEVAVETPLETARGWRVREDDIVVVPILRAGLAMAEGVGRILTGARTGHVGFQRDEETLEPFMYYAKLPPDPERLAFLLVDPMLATGGSACAATAWLKKQGARDIRFMCLVTAPEGASRMADEHPDVPIYTAALDERLDESGYIRPGLGDAGDRIFGTLTAFVD